MSLVTRGLMWSGLCGWVGALLLAGEPAPARFRLEAEEVIVNKEALRKDRMTPVTWNFWTTDKDAEKKWSGCGMVVQSPPVKADRASPEEGAPPLRVVLPLPDEEARTFGTNIPRLRAVCIVCCAAMTASCVAMCGQVGWVGLLVPHVCRLLFGNSHARLLPACISCGACFLMIVDTLARTISAAEIPVSILTAILGAPIFITIVRRKGGWSL